MLNPGGGGKGAESRPRPTPCLITVADCEFGKHADTVATAEVPIPDGNPVPDDLCLDEDDWFLESDLRIPKQCARRQLEIERGGWWTLV